MIGGVGLGGTLRLDNRGCVQLDTEFGQTVLLFPWGFTTRSIGDQVEVVNADGGLSARIGDDVFLGVVGPTAIASISGDDGSVDRDQYCLQGATEFYMVYDIAPNSPSASPASPVPAPVDELPSIASIPRSSSPGQPSATATIGAIDGSIVAARLDAFSRMEALAAADPDRYSGISSDGQGRGSPVTIGVHVAADGPGVGPEMLEAIDAATAAGVMVTEAQEKYSTADLMVVMSKLLAAGHSTLIDDNLVYYGTDPQSNTVKIGLTDPDNDFAEALKVQYGDLISTTKAGG